MKKYITLLLIIIIIILFGIKFCHNDNYDLIKARELVDKYYYKNYFTGDMFDGLTDKYKFWLAYSKLDSKEKQQLSCDSLYQSTSFSKDINGYKIDNSRYCDGNVNVVTYSDINRAYKELFGSDESIKKQDVSQFNYISNRDIFVELGCRCDESFSIVNVFGIPKAKKNKDELVITVQYSLLNKVDKDNYYSKLDNTKYLSEDVFSEGFEKKYIDKNKNIINVYELTYKKDNGEYVLKTLVKVK